MKIFLSLVLMGVCGTALAAEPVRVPVTRDAWISAFPAEQEGNNGGSPRMKLKGIQEFALVDGDWGALAGKKVARAELWLHLESKDAPLGRVTVSTVGAAWEEGTGSSYDKGTGASFRWAAPGQTWAGAGSDVTWVVAGLGGTRWGFGDASARDGAGWQVVPVEAGVVEACAAGASHGVFIQDDTGSEYVRDGEKFKWKLFPNRYVASRDMNKTVAPYFLVWLAEGAPAPVKQTPKAAAPVAAGVLPPAVAGATPVSKALLTDLTGEPLGDHLAAARNEAVAFFVARGAGEAVEIEAPGLQARVWGMEKDALVPASGTGRVVGEIQVPREAAAGVHAVTIRVGEKKWPVELRVWDFTLPDRLSFVPEMNAYGLPGQAKDEVAWYRLAHEHRLNLNVLRYGWNGQVSDGCAPVAKAGGWDWTAWDARFGPLLDGTAFKDLPRSGVPVDAFYLPLNEHWPADVHAHFKGGYWVENAFDADYWAKFSAMAKELASHAKARGWTEPQLQFYLNNKVYFKEQRGTWSSCSAPWVFDEPVNTQDFWALRRYGQEFNRAARGIAPNALFRCDISRPEWQRDLLDGVTGMEVVSGALRPYRERISARQAAWGTQVTLYGSTAAPAERVIQPAAWCLDAWCLGADGVLPWQTIGSRESWEKPDALSLFYPARGAGDPVVSPSVRLKSYRQGQQLVEYLMLYAKASGQPRRALEPAVKEFLGLQASLKKKNDDDAGTMEFGPGVAGKLGELRARLGAWLDAKKPAPARSLVERSVRTEEKERQVLKRE